MTQISFLSLNFIQIFVQPRSWFKIEVIGWNRGLNSWDPFACRIILPLWVVVGQCCWFKHSRWSQFDTESVGLDVAFPVIWIASHENQNSLNSHNMWTKFLMVYLKSMKIGTSQLSLICYLKTEKRDKATLTSADTLACL